MNFSLSVPPLSTGHFSLPMVAAQRQAKGTLSLAMETDYLQIQPVNTGQIFFLQSHWSSGIGGARGETIYIHNYQTLVFMLDFFAGFFCMYGEYRSTYFLLQAQQTGC